MSVRSPLSRPILEGFGRRQSLVGFVQSTKIHIVSERADCSEILTAQKLKIYHCNVIQRTFFDGALELRLIVSSVMKYSIHNMKYQHLPSQLSFAPL